MSLLQVQHINSGYGKKQVLFEVDLSVEEGEAVLLIGSNGSGKSTLFKAIYGLVPVWNSIDQGKIIFNGMNVTNTKCHSLIKKGIMYVPQKNELFEDMTIEQNLEMSLLHLNNKKETSKRVQEVYAQVDILANNKKQIAAQLSGGERKMLSLGTVLANRPKMVLYDEPFSGLSGKNVNLVLNWLHVLKEKGTTLVIIEHRIKELMAFVDRVVGLKLGFRNTEALSDVERIKSFMI